MKLATPVSRIARTSHQSFSKGLPMVDIAVLDEEIGSMMQQIRAALVLRRRHKIHPSRHGLACPGHPRLAAQTQPVSVDARHKAGHDDCSETAPSECA
jgi:hypothetical protein